MRRRLALKVDETLKWGVRKHVVLADAGYGDCQEFRDGANPERPARGARTRATWLTAQSSGRLRR
jgi:hypothetical protein